MQTLKESQKCFCQYQFWCKNVNSVQKKKKKKKRNFGRNVDFFIKCALLLKVIMFLQNMLFLEKCDFLCEGFYALTEC